MPVGTEPAPASTLRGDVAEATERLCQAAAQTALSPERRGLPPFDWTTRCVALAPMLAHLHGIAPLVAASADPLPPSLAAVFLRHAQLSAVRAERLLALRDAFLIASRDCGASPIALKGARTVDTLYPEPGLRPMADLDFLCAAADLEACRMAATRLGLVALGGTPRHAVFGASGARVVAILAEHPGNPIKVEVHTRLMERFFGDAVDVTPAIQHPGGQIGHAIHALLHASQHAMARTLRFCQMIDIGLMFQRFDRSDWQSLEDALLPLGLEWVYPPLALAQVYFPGVVDAGVLARARRAAPWLARRAVWRISDLSYSAIGDGGLRVRLRWARRPIQALGAPSGAFLAAAARRDPGRANELAPAFAPAPRPGWQRMLAWIGGRGLRPISARLIELAPAAWEPPP